jgi:hypothetical protein
MMNKVQNHQARTQKLKLLAKLALRVLWFLFSGDTL